MRAAIYPSLLGVAILLALSSAGYSADADDAAKAIKQGTSAFQKHDYDLAIRGLNDAIRLDPNSPKACDVQSL
jgi:hypothetical protein